MGPHSLLFVILLIGMNVGMIQELKKLLPVSAHGAVETLVAQGSEMCFKKGEVILGLGETIVNLTLVLEGRISVYRVSDKDKRQLMYFITPGDLCGISATAAPLNLESNVIAIADEDSRVLTVPGGVMRGLIVAEEGWFEFVNYARMKNMEDSMKCLDSLTFASLSERLESYLDEYAELTNSDEVVKSHSEIATDLNSSREVVSRLLKKMEQQQSIEMGHGRIRMTQFTDKA